MSDVIALVEAGLPTTPMVIEGRPPETHRLLDRTKHYHIPGFSLAVISQGKINWTQGYGVMDMTLSKIFSQYCCHL